MDKTYSEDRYLDIALSIVLGVLIVVLCTAGYLVYDIFTYDASEQELDAEVQEAVDKYIRAKTSKVIYDESISLMDQGYVSTREEYVIEDPEYVVWREDTYPEKGEYKEVSVPISVTALDTGVTQDEFNYVVECISCIPEEFVRYCSKDGWVVQITSTGNELGSQGYENVITHGQTNHEEKTITVHSDYSDCIYHEFGHILEEYAREELEEAGFFELTADTELSVLYNHNADNSVYIYLNHGEQLAESFYDYIWYPREMQAQAPTLYRIYSDTIENISK